MRLSLHAPLGLIALLLAIWIGQQAVHATPPARVSVDAPPTATPAVPHVAAVTAAATATATLPTPVRAETLADRVDRLSRSADPLDAFAAYRLATECVQARRNEVLLRQADSDELRQRLREPAVACGDITPGQVASRLQWLERAGLAGVHGALIAWVSEGPTGDGIADEDEAHLRDPVFVEHQRKTRAMAAAGARTGDEVSLAERSGEYDQGNDDMPPDPLRALTYWVAFTDRMQARTGQPAQLLDGFTRAHAAGQTPEAVQVAIAEGHRIARVAQPLPGDH